LLTYLEEFKRQLAELLYTALPRDYSEALDNPNLLDEPLTDQEIDLLYKPLRVKAVFAIRSDQMSVLNELTSHLPNILKVFYELKALSPAQARQAIVNPAQFAGDFATPTFTYAPDALEKLLHELTDERNREVDTAQLQILLQHIERKVVAQGQQTHIAAADLGDLRAVYENYYRDRINELPDRTERERACELIEERLIAEGRRVSYDIALCLQMVKRETLDRLVEARLLRREPNSLGSYSYELSHDTLVAPVSEARAQRRQAEALREAQEKAEKDRIEKEKTARQLRIVRSLLIAAVVALVVAIGAGYYAFEQKKEADKQTQIAINKEKEALREKEKAQKALKDFLGVKIKELDDAINTFTQSGDKNLVKKYTNSRDSLQKQYDLINLELQNTDKP
jgi:hypothetical protein